MTKILNTIIALLLLSTGWLYAVESEPNDVRNDADKLTLNSSNTGAIDIANDVDWWKVTTTSDGKLDVTLAVSNGLYCYFKLYDNDGTTLLKSDYTSGTKTYSQDGLAPGTYYIYIYAFNAGQLPAYTISNVLNTIAIANDAEPNDAYTQADVFALNGSVTGHIGYYYNGVSDVADWWSVTTTGNGKLDLQMISDNGQYLYWKLYDGDGTTLLKSDYTSGTKTYFVDGLAAGTYYVYVYPFYAGGFTPYTMSSTFTDPVVANDVEPNNSKSQSKNLPLNGSKTGQVGYYYNHVADSSDWFKVTTDLDGALKLTMASQNGQYIYFKLYDKNGTTLLKSDYTSGTKSYTVDGLAAGTYYINIHPFYANGFVPYTIEDTLIVAPVANDPEPNNGKSQATSFAVGGTVTGHSGYYYDGVADSSDWYKIITTEDGQISITITSNNGQYIYYQLYDNDATTLLKSSFTSGTASHSTDGLAAGTYFVKVYPYYSSGFIPYTLTNSLATYTNANDGLDNDLAKNAATLGSNLETPGHVGFRYNGGARDVRDWWKINYTGKGDLTVTLKWEPRLCCGSPYVYLKIYADTAASPIFSTYNSSGTINANLTALAKQYYYVQVVMYYSTEATGYNLTPTFTQKEKAKITLQSSVTGSDCASSSLTYKCTKSEKPYTVQLFRFGKKYGDPLNVKNSTPFTISSLPPGNYYATVYGDGATGQGKGTSVTTTLVPVPTNLSTSNIKSAKATLNWDTLVCVDYDSIYYRVVGSGTWSKIKTGTNNSAYNLTGLTASTMYEWMVAHVVDTLSEKATSAYSAITTFTTAALKEGESLNESGLLSLYPNPASGSTTLQFTNNEAGEAVMTVFDALGRNLQSERLLADNGVFIYELNLAPLSPGLYIIRVMINGTEHAIKLVKE
ncbi:MAG: T9SS type A sorting domain-containing protein [Chitinophagales bacterium]|nr:T9SS type A sorting domain-containing protein [Chitinophagales bacterium]